MAAGTVLTVKYSVTLTLLYALARALTPLDQNTPFVVTNLVPVIFVLALLAVILPPTFKLPPNPAPPTTTNAPVVVLVLDVLLAATTLPFSVAIPLDVNVVKAPVAAVLAPTG